MARKTVQPVVSFVELSTLKPNSRNPRKIGPDAFEKLVKSIKRDAQFMELRPIIVDENRVIIGGNQRYKALLEIGKKKVPSSWVKVAEGLTQAQRNRFVLLDNSPEGMSGYWDFDVLQEDWSPKQLDMLGFGFREVNYEEVWKGLPTHEQEDREFYKELIVRFMTEEDYKDFQEKIGQELTEKTKSIWHPFQFFDQMGSTVEYADGEEAKKD